MTDGQADKTGIESFLSLTKYYGRIVAWALAGSLAPLLAGIVNLAPPWPPAIVPVTSLFELIALIFAFQFLQNRQRRQINIILIVSTAVFVACLVLYLLLLSQFVFEEPLSKLRFVKGFLCTQTAKIVYPDLCPYYGDAELKKAEWEASRLWTLESITIVRIGLVLSWFSVFVWFTSILGSFVVFQMTTRAPKIHD
jgi:hypothetical protein